MVKQIHWRILGAVALATCGGLAWFGSEWSVVRQSPGAFMAYWAVILVSFIVVVYCVLLDLRYIRAQYAIDRRDLFNETLGDEEFRKVLRAAQEEKARKPASNPPESDPPAS